MPGMMQVLLDKQKYSNCVGLKTGASERDGVPPTGEDPFNGEPPVPSPLRVLLTRMDGRCMVDRTRLVSVQMYGRTRTTVRCAPLQVTFHNLHRSASGLVIATWLVPTRSGIQRTEEHPL